MTIQLELNGEAVMLDEPLTVAQALRLWSPNESAVAVAVNRRVVPRGQHAQFQLQDGDQVELVTPMQGG